MKRAGTSGRSLERVDSRAHLLNTSENRAVMLLRACREGSLALVCSLLEKKTDIHCSDIHQRKPLHYACQRYGFEKVVDLLLDRGAEVNLVDEDGNTALDYACQRGTKAMLHVLLDKGAAVSVRGIAQATPLHYACRRHGFSEVILRFIWLGARVDALTSSRSSPLHYACECGASEAVVNALIEKWRDGIDAVDDQGKTALHYACIAGGDGGAALCLIRAGAKVDAVDYRDNMPVHYASQYSPPEVLDALIEKGADVAALGESGRSPLHVVSLGGQYSEHITRLVEAGADVGVVTKYSGKTPLFLAVLRNCDETIARLMVAFFSKDLDTEQPGWLENFESSFFSKDLDTERAWDACRAEFESLQRIVPESCTFSLLDLYQCHTTHDLAAISAHADIQSILMDPTFQTQYPRLGMVIYKNFQKGLVMSNKAMDAVGQARAQSIFFGQSPSAAADHFPPEECSQQGSRAIQSSVFTMPVVP